MMEWNGTDAMYACALFFLSFFAIMFGREGRNDDEEGRLEITRSCGLFFCFSSSSCIVVCLSCVVFEVGGLGYIVTLLSIT